jgi:hypothetical protein
MLYREIVILCSEIHTKHINTLCGQNVQFCSLNLIVQKITGFYRVKWWDIDELHIYA